MLCENNNHQAVMRVSSTSLLQNQTSDYAFLRPNLLFLGLSFLVYPKSTFFRY